MLITIGFEESEYYSRNDERRFYLGLREIGVVQVKGGSFISLGIEVDQAQLDEEHIRELIALFYRYGVSLKALQVLCTPENENWLKGNKKAFWYKKMWGEKS